MNALNEKALKAIAERAREMAIDPSPVSSQIHVRQAEERFIAAMFALELGQLNRQLGQLIDTLKQSAGRR
jgi:hypothetical protein